MLKSFLEVIPITALVGLCYILWRWISLRRSRDTVRWHQELAPGLFVCYLTGLAALVLAPPNFWSDLWYYLRTGHADFTPLYIFPLSANLEPTLWLWLKGELILGSWVVAMLVGNFAMFLPLGFFLPLVCPRLRGRTLGLLVLCIPLFIELFQLLVGRSLDIDDLLLNPLGILAGYGIGCLVKKLTTPT